jgi:GR25 family glycosyltransferase involved in LPS biosynthesis
MEIKYLVNIIMTTFNELIQHHFYINLDCRIDRKEKCEEELKKIGLTPNRFPAIKTKQGIVGCGISHLRCLEYAKENKLPYITIFEDDIVITKPNQVKNIVNRILDNNVEWDVLCLAGNSFKPHKEECDDYVVVSRMYCGTAYIVKEHFYDILIDNIRDGLTKILETGLRDYSWDAHWIQLQRTHRFLLINPLSIYQRPDFSDIEKKNVDYKDCMLNFDK